MMYRLREADCPQTAFVKALGDLCPRLVFQCQSVIANPTKPETQIMLEGNCLPFRPIQPLDRPLHSADRSQKTIQYP
jgi:hypothetical protein